MTKDIDLDYIPDSFAGPTDVASISTFCEWLHRIGNTKVYFDESYVQHMTQFNGGIPGKSCFKTNNGRERMITRFLNFAERDHPLIEYSVESTWSMLSGSRLGQHLMPFAELFAGDMLCFEYKAQSQRPRVVIWLHEESSDESGPVTELVAECFDAFLGMLYTPTDTSPRNVHRGQA